MRETSGSGSLADWFFRRAGYEPTNAGADVDDPNAANPAEFTLDTSNGGLAYVTSATLRGRSSGITAIMTTDAATITPGEHSITTVHRLAVPRDSNAQIVQEVKDAFPEVPWATPGFGAFEVTPAGSGQWGVTLGFDQLVTYRAVLRADGSACLFGADQTPIRCTDEQSDGSGLTVRPISEFSDAEFDQLLDEVLAEAKRRTR